MPSKRKLRETIPDFLCYYDSWETVIEFLTMSDYRSLRLVCYTFQQMFRPLKHRAICMINGCIKAKCRSWKSHPVSRGLWFEIEKRYHSVFHPTYWLFLQMKHQFQRCAFAYEVGMMIFTDKTITIPAETLIFETAHSNVFASLTPFRKAIIIKTRDGVKTKTLIMQVNNGRLSFWTTTKSEKFFAQDSSFVLLDTELVFAEKETLALFPKFPKYANFPALLEQQETCKINPS